ncbi:UNVERIFIED_CONTAM: hypothetical protein GTU68_065909 [Idotea baltica]|nr:hypothetical protein [Idotea baltica]
MPNLRFLPNPTIYTLKDLAELCGCVLYNKDDADIKISGVNTLNNAGAGDLSFLTNSKYKDDFISTSATACIVGEGSIESSPKGVALLVSETPYVSYAIAASKIFEGYDVDDFEDELISSSAKIGKNCKVSKNCEIAAGAEIGDGVQIHNFVRIGKNVKIGSGTVVKSGAVITHSIIGSNCLIHPGAAIGQDGFGFAPGPKGVIKVPQLGGVKIGDNVEIGANTTIDRGALEDTMIGSHTKIDNLVQLGHNVKVGGFCFLAAQVGVAGSAEIGDQVMIGGQAGVNGHIKVGSKVKVAGQAGVLSNVKDGEVLGGTPAINMRKWIKMTTVMKRMVEKNKVVL